MSRKGQTVTYPSELRAGRVYCDCGDDKVLVLSDGDAEGVRTTLWSVLGLSFPGEATYVALPAKDVGAAKLILKLGCTSVWIWDGHLITNQEAGLTQAETLRLFQRLGRALGYEVEP